MPRATKVIAVTESFRPLVHPKCEARSPMTAVRTPITKMEQMKHTQPFR